MSTRDYRTKAKTDYSLLRKKHKITAKGTIYENDIMTISKMDELFTDGKIYLKSDGNFKFSIRPGSPEQKKHYSGEWAVPTSNVESGLPTSESVIKLKPDYTSISDFAYYGSATDMFKAVVNNLAENFPAELIFTNEVEVIDGEKWYKIDNQYDIDTDSESVSNDTVYNTLRYFCVSLNSYCLMDASGNTENFSEYSGDTMWSVEHYKTKCNGNRGDFGELSAKISLLDGEIEFYVRLINGEKKLYYKDTSLSMYRIRPVETIINEFFYNLSPFESVLLDRQSNPIYTCKLETFNVTDTTSTRSFVNYSWPSSYGYNPDMTGPAFEIYLKSMISLCLFYDDYNTNNIWRKLTHEAIKNLDWTFLRKLDSGTVDLSEIDSTRIEAILKLYGRQYDDIKMYIDSIKNSNTVSYSERSNAPDYSMSDILENHGFDAVSLSITDDESIKTDALYGSQSEGYTASDANVAFQRRMILNSKYLLGAKGTRQGIQAILAMFGIGTDEYELNEYVVVASGRSSYEDFKGVGTPSGVTYPMADNMTYINAYRNDVFYYSDEDTGYDYSTGLAGLPLAPVFITDENNEEKAYVIPWFSRNTTYDGGLCFQQYGGWKKCIEKKINLDIAPNVTKIKSDNLHAIYGETLSPLKYVKDVSDLITIPESSLINGDIYYVSDITNLLEYYQFKDDTEKSDFLSKTRSHYFILNNKGISDIIGFYKSIEEGGGDEDNSGRVINYYGWVNVAEEEYNTTDDKVTENGKRVLYYESIVEDTIGNNQHFGNDGYDDGNSYVEAMTKPFMYAAKNNQFDWFSDEQVALFKDYGFDPIWNLDNRKSWYFVDYFNMNDHLYEVNPYYTDKTIEEYYRNNIYVNHACVSDTEFSCSFTDSFGNGTIGCSGDTEFSCQFTEEFGNKIENN